MGGRSVGSCWVQWSTSSATSGGASSGTLHNRFQEAFGTDACGNSVCQGEESNKGRTSNKAPHLHRPQIPHLPPTGLLS